MARKRKQSATADEHNAEAEEVRQEARDAQSNVVDLIGAEERWRLRQAAIVEFAARLDAAQDAAATVRDEIKSIRLDAKAQDVDWRALSEMVRWRRKDESKRLKAERSRREIARAFGWVDGSQVDMFTTEAPPEGQIPGLEREYLGPTEPEVSPDMQAALDSGFFTRDELGLGASEVDEPETDGIEVEEEDAGEDFDDLMRRAGVTETEEE